MATHRLTVNSVRIWNRTIRPGRVFDLQLPLGDAAAGYQAMDDRQAVKVLLRP